jgi:hypothetical protein
VLSSVQCVLSAAYLCWHRDHRDDSEEEWRRRKKQQKHKDEKKDGRKKDDDEKKKKKKKKEKKKKKKEEKKAARERERSRSRSITPEAVAGGRRISYPSRHYGHDDRRRSPARSSPRAGRSRCVLELACLLLSCCSPRRVAYCSAMTGILHQVFIRHASALGLWTTSRPRLWQKGAGYPPPSRILPT